MPTVHGGHGPHWPPQGDSRGVQVCPHHDRLLHQVCGDVPPEVQISGCSLQGDTQFCVQVSVTQKLWTCVWMLHVFLMWYLVKLLLCSLINYNAISCRIANIFHTTKDVIAFIQQPFLHQNYSHALFIIDFIYVWPSYRYGPPQKLLSDRGKEFVNKLNDTLSSRFGIERLVTSAYHPQTNGLDERTNQTLKDRLGKMVNEHQDDWEDYLEEVAYSIRTATQATTKFSPFFLMFNRKPRLLGVNIHKYIYIARNQLV